ncbi:succinate dehydrogenase assembly factor 2 [Enterovibrio paralichthyis]|uniref:FAD assembly factor SdhE n=1 Tax=Enterovibrio paralichthyis TaxID=2853805 RepID=UPI001C46E497|nr:succinate dehydrogenase assembly factor 2 [Enterovibrio paralichthyis]MBV7297805.1 succinate dehydrogenase assembly factor 2 [Enterovibrio paralichthyis]
MLGAEDKARIRWACRRGMLELDVIIMPFFEECFDSLSEQEKHDFVALLECDDPDLFTWMMGHGRSENPALAAMTDKIVAHNRSKLR